jgi:predicted transposase YbfD/YdcC
MLKSLYDRLKKLSDPRVIGRTKYCIADVLLLAFLATMVGCFGWTDIRNWAISHMYILSKLLPTLKSAPSEDTISRVLGSVDQVELTNIFTKLSKDFLRRWQRKGKGRKKASTLPDIIAIDGKTVKGAVPRGELKSFTHIVNAVCGLITLAAMQVYEKSNEITIIPKVLELLAGVNLLKGKIVTTDAMGCQKSIADEIIKHGADYLFCFKGNHGLMHKDVVNLFEKWVDKYPDDFDVKTFTSETNLVAGRVERRVITVVRFAPELTKWISGAGDWLGLKTLIKVERFVSYTNPNKKDTKEARFFISSLNLPTPLLLEATIRHWNVETVHNKLDCSYGEDKCKIWRNGTAEILSLLRKLGLNFVAPIAQRFKDDRESVRSVYKTLDNNWNYLLDVLLLKPDEVISPKQARRETGKGINWDAVPILAPARAA